VIHTESIQAYYDWCVVTVMCVAMSLCCLGSDKAVFVMDKHAVISGPMKPPFPAGSEFALFG